MRAAPHPKAVDGVDLCIGAKNLALKSFEALVAPNRTHIRSELASRLQHIHQRPGVPNDAHGQGMVAKSEETHEAQQ